MIFNADQKAEIHQLLSKNLKYQESFDEVYDHVLTAISERDFDTVNPTEISMKIINDDFGGVDALKQMEKDRMLMVWKQLRKKHLKILAEHIKFPLIAFTLILSAATFIAIHAGVNRKVFIVLFFVIAIMPVTFYLKKEVKRRFFGYKSSIKDPYVFQTSTFMANIVNVLIAIPRLFYNNYNIFKDSHAVVLTIIMVVYVVYALGFIRLYQEEFKLQFIK